jgi:hypothetical protein
VVNKYLINGEEKGNNDENTSRGKLVEGEIDGKKRRRRR